jgi:hypothetical protein
MIPRPAGYTSGDDNAAEFVGVTTGGHRAINLNTDPDCTYDQEWRRNARNIAEMLSDSLQEDTGW